MPTDLRGYHFRYVCRTNFILFVLHGITSTAQQSWYCRMEENAHKKGPQPDDTHARAHRPSQQQHKFDCSINESYSSWLKGFPHVSHWQSNPEYRQMFCVYSCTRHTFIGIFFLTCMRNCTLQVRMKTDKKSVSISLTFAELRSFELLLPIIFGRT